MTLERDFVKRYLFDSTYGGTYFSVDGKGNVLDASKDVIFQTNVILFLGGMNSQNPDPEISRYVNSAAEFILRYLKWGPDGIGTWYASSDRTGGSPQRMSWLVPSEAYVSYGLLWAYKITGNRAYLDVALSNLNYQMSHFPDGRVLTGDHGADNGYRSPERMSYYSMWQVTGNESYLGHLKKFHTALVGRNAWEHGIVNGTLVKLYLHGNAVIDELQYALVSGDETALSEGRQLVDVYRASGASGREYSQGLLAMDLALWTVTGEEKYRADALRAYYGLLEFWDPSPPFGFWSDDGVTKTCFSRGYPLVDMTPPMIEADPEGQKVSAKIIDPGYEWLDLAYRGIGVNPDSVYLFYSFDGQNWSGNMRMTQTRNDTFTALVPLEVASRDPRYLISASDYFNNTSTVEFTKTSSPQSLTVAPTDSLGFSLGVIAAGVAAVALAVSLLCCLAHRPASGLVGAIAPAEPTRYVVCRCPYWHDCARKHHACPTCNALRAQGACCMCQGTPTDSCNHPPGV